MVYILLLAGLIVISPMCKHKLHIGRKKYSGKIIYTYFFGVVLISLVAFRALEIGNDTYMYEYIFNSLKKTDSFSVWLENNWYTSGTELGFYYLGFLVSRIFEFRVFLIICALISVGPFIFLIEKYSENKLLSYILYICFPYFTFAMSGLRQACAMGILVIAYHFMKEKNLKLYLICVLLAFSFHTSALLFLPVYWIEKIPNNKLVRICAVLGAACTFLLKDKLWQIASMFSRQQYAANDAGGILMYLFIFVSVLLGIYYYKEFIIQKDFRNYITDTKILFYLQVLAVMISPLATVNSAINRIYFYYHMFIILYAPRLVLLIPRKIEKILVLMFFLIASLGFFATQVCNPIQKYTPYLFMWQ